MYQVLKTGHKPSHAYFGLEAMTTTPDYAHIHNDDPNVQRLPAVHGALVMRVVPDYYHYVLPHLSSSLSITIVIIITLVLTYTPIDP